MMNLKRLWPTLNKASETETCVRKGNTKPWGREALHLNFYNIIGEYSVMMIGKELFFSLFGEIHMRQGGDLYFIPKIPCKA